MEFRHRAGLHSFLFHDDYMHCRRGYHLINSTELHQRLLIPYLYQKCNSLSPVMFLIRANRWFEVKDYSAGQFQSHPRSAQASKCQCCDDYAGAFSRKIASAYNFFAFSYQKRSTVICFHRPRRPENYLYLSSIYLTLPTKNYR